MELLLKKEVAARLRCGVLTVDRLRKAGKLKSFKIGGVVRFRECDVNDYINNELERQTKATA